MQSPEDPSKETLNPKPLPAPCLKVFVRQVTQVKPVQRVNPL